MAGFIHSCVLFKHEDGSAVRFYMRPCKARLDLKPMIEHGGGIISNKINNETVRLLEPGAAAPTGKASNYIVSTYITECVMQNKLLDMEKYRIKETTEVVSNDSVEEVSSNLTVAESALKGRKKYRLDDERNMLEYLLQGNRCKCLGGNVVWKRMEKAQVTGHSWQSMKDHFRKHMQGRLDSYDLSDEVIQKLQNSGDRSKRAMRHGDVSALFHKAADKKKSAQTERKKDVYDMSSTGESVSENNQLESPKLKRKLFSGERSPYTGEKTNSAAERTGLKKSRIKANASSMNGDKKTMKENEAGYVTPCDADVEITNNTAGSRQQMSPSKPNSPNMSTPNQQSNTSIDSGKLCRRRSLRKVEIKTCEGNKEKGQLLNSKLRVSTVTDSDNAQQNGDHIVNDHGQHTDHRAIQNTRTGRTDKVVSSTNPAEMRTVNTTTRTFNFRNRSSPVSHKVSLSNHDDLEPSGPTETCRSNLHPNKSNPASSSSKIRNKFVTSSTFDANKADQIQEKRTRHSKQKQNSPQNSSTHHKISENSEISGDNESNGDLRNYIQHSLDDRDADQTKHSQPHDLSIEDIFAENWETSDDNSNMESNGDLRNYIEDGLDDGDADQTNESNEHLSIEEEETVSFLKRICERLELEKVELIDAVYACSGHVYEALHWIIHGTLSNGLPAWTPEDDSVLESDDVDAITELYSKFGKEAAEERLLFLMNVGNKY